MVYNTLRFGLLWISDNHLIIYGMTNVNQVSLTNIMVPQIDKAPSKLHDQKQSTSIVAAGRLRQLDTKLLQSVCKYFDLDIAGAQISIGSDDLTTAILTAVANLEVNSFDSELNLDTL